MYNNWRRGWDVVPKGSQTFQPTNRRCGIICGAPRAILLGEGRQRGAKGCPIVGSSNYQVLRDLVDPDAPSSKNLEGINGHAKEALQTYQTGYR